MAWSTTPTPFCIDSYKVHYRTEVVALNPGQAITNTYKIVEQTKVAHGMTEQTAKNLADSINREDGHFGEARKVYASDGWDVTDTSTTETLVQSSQSSTWSPV